uniref:Uncharacterized protein n=1 Tax=Arundo donax TaxID=35708 RepID=A0A0A9D827_ARUDO
MIMRQCRSRNEIHLGITEIAFHTFISCVGTWFKRAPWNWVYHFSEYRYGFGCLHSPAPLREEIILLSWGAGGHQL